MKSNPKLVEETKRKPIKIDVLACFKSNFQSTFIWFELLFAAQPTYVDYVLIFAGTLLAIAAGIPFPLLGVNFGQLVDNFNVATCAAEGTTDIDPFQYENAINDKVIRSVYIAAIALVLIYGQLTCWNIISQRLAQRMRIRYVSSMLCQPPSVFDVRQASGQVSSRLNADITAIQAGTSEKVGNIIVTISFFLTVMVISFTKQPGLAGMLMFMVPAFLISGFLGGRYSNRFANEQNAKIASASSIASEALSHITVVQAFGAAPRLEARFSSYMAGACHLGKKKSAIAAVQTGMLYFLAYCGIALAFWQGSKLIAQSVLQRNNNSTVGEIYAVVYLLVDACIMLGGIAPSLPFLLGAVAAYRRLKEDIETASQIDGTSTRGDVLGLGKPKSLAFRNVSFEYETRPGERVLQDVTLDFPPGSYTAIVGPSGSGKSTIASLIARLYDPVEGSIKLDSHDLRHLNVRSLRSFIGFVQQEPSLFDCSIIENIAMGLVNCPKPEIDGLKHLLSGTELARAASMGKNALVHMEAQGGALAKLARLIKRAADQADASTFIERLDDGYGTSAGISGGLLSGGQRQRIALARALIRDPEILVLDEATSALDSTSEKKVQRAIENAAAEKRTIISIAHRLSTIRNADHIIVMKKGCVVEKGSYEKLMEIPDGEFAHMARLQSIGHGSKFQSGSSSRISLDVASTLNEEGLSEGKLDISEAEEPIVETGPISNLKDDMNSEEISKESDSAKPLDSVAQVITWLIRPSLSLAVVAIISAVIVGSTFTSTGILFGFVVGELNPCQSPVDRIRQQGAFYGGMYFMVASIVLVANFLAWWTFGVISEKLLYSLRVLSLNSMLEQTLDWHNSEGRNPSSLLAVITKDSMAVSSFSGSTFGTILAIIINVLASIIVSHIFAWKIAIVCLVTLPILLATGFMQLRMLARYEERHKNAFTRATTLATEAIESIRTVAVLSLERNYMDSFRRLLAPPRKEIVRASATTNIFLAIAYTSGAFINSLAYWWGSQLIMKGEYTQRDFLIILVAMLASAQLWASMFTLAPEFSRAVLALKRVMDIVSIGAEAQMDRRGPDASALAHDIEAAAEAKNGRKLLAETSQRGSKVVFDKVSFAYPNRPDSSVLKDITFTVSPNQFCGLVGPSGAGKSTIMNMVQRLYEPNSGFITVDDRDITTLPTSFRDSIALVPQDPSLFDGSIRFNVGLGAPPGHEASNEEIEEACKLANIHDTIIALPDGYETECGPNASRLSGGQKQRVAIARALVRRPRLLLLDESTSALDAASEAALQQGLERAARGTTVIAITHRLRTVQRADLILMLEGGSIVDCGTHAELMERRESYRLNAMQQILQ